MSEPQWFAPAASFGRRLDPDRPAGELAVLEIEHQATEQKVARARMFFEQADLSDFEPLGSKGRRFLHIATQVEYLLDESQVTDSPDPTTSGVEFFIVDGWRIMFLRRRDHEPAVQRVFHGTFTSGRLETGPDGRDRVVPTKETGTYDPDHPWIVAS